MAARRERGFTLLEIIGALFVSGLILAAVAGSLVAVTGAWERTGKRVAGREWRRVITIRLRHELANVNQGALGSRPEFEGSAFELSFVANGPLGPRRLRLGLEGERLVLRENPLRRPQGLEPAAITLAEPVQRLALSYYDARDRAWRDYWSGEDETRPPALVKIVADLGTAAKARPTPELIMPIYAGRLYGAREVEPYE